MMKAAYYDATKPGSYGGIRPLARYTGKSVSTVRNWLASQDAYTLHKPVRRNFPRRKTFSKGIQDLFQTDLADMQQLSNFNDGHRYFLVVIDVFTKKAEAVALKDKRGPTVASALDKIFSRWRPEMVQSDQGTEYLNRDVQSVFTKHNIKHYSTFNEETKAAVAERLIRTLKNRLYRYFTHHHTNRWVDVLDDVVASYNNSFHRSIGMAPNEVTFENAQIVARRLFPEKPPPKWKFNIGDKVRISRYKNIFRKGYLRGWSEEIFTVANRFATSPVVYALVDASSEAIKGKFYEPELQKVDKADHVYEIERIVKTRRRGGKLQYFVKWLGWPEKFNTWEDHVVT